MVLAYLASAYPSASVSKETATVYFDVLKDLPFEACRDEARRLVRSSQWFPSAAVIRRGVCEQAGLLSKSPDRAWNEITGAVKEIGIYGKAEWSDAIVAEAVRTIGWREICMSENQGVLRAHFFKVYEKIASSADAKIVGAEDLSRVLASGRKGLMSSEENAVKTLPEASETLAFAGETEK